MKKKKVLFVAVFDEEGKSTNNSQLRELKKLCDCHPFNYRVIAKKIGHKNRDEKLLKKAKEGNFDLIIFAKCNGISNNIINKISNYVKTCLWFMDPLVTYKNAEFIEKTRVCNYFACDKKNVFDLANRINKNSKVICEGFDERIDKPFNLNKEYDVSFIGNVYGNRNKLIESIKKSVFITNNAYSSDHARTVSKSKINLNICTSEGASDRVYKIMAAGGFLLTDDWEGRSDHFEDGKHLVIFKDISDLNVKIEYYLNNEKERKDIARQGMEISSKFSRSEWAKSILNFCLEEDF